MKSLLRSLNYLSIVVLFAACHDNPPTPSPDNQVITAKIDGISFKVSKSPVDESGFDVIVANLVTYNNQNDFVLYFGGVDLTWENATAVDIGLVLIGPDLATLKVGTIFEWRGTDTEPTFDTYTAAGTSSMVLLNEETAYSSITDDFGNIQILITAFDFEGKRISGTFEFTAYDEGEDRTVVVTGGEFKNISW